MAEMEDMFGFDRECYKKYGKIRGIYDGRQPILATTDPDLIKTIFIKEFCTLFTNRQDVGLNGPMTESLLTVEDDQWKRIRSVLSPNFTSGRLKEMCPIIKHYTENLVKYAEKKAKLNESADMKDIFGTYSLDVVTSIALSVDVDSINNPDDLIMSNIKKLISFNIFNPVLLLAVIFPVTIPILAKLGFSFYPRDANVFLMNVLASSKAKREKGLHTERRTEDQQSAVLPFERAAPLNKIVADLVVVSVPLSYLPTHPNNKKVSPSLGSAFTDRVDFLQLMVDSQMTEASSQSQDDVSKSTDKAYWPEPEEFRHKRFSKKNRESRDPNIFLPFGMGPRNCIRMRFAQLVMKVALASLFQHLTLVPCEETQIRLELDVKGPMHPKKPVILNFVPRVNAASKE
ncbi:cytochrome P450 3A56-like [Mustelus asterias]